MLSAALQVTLTTCETESGKEITFPNIELGTESPAGLLFGVSVARCISHHEKPRQRKGKLTAKHFNLKTLPQALTWVREESGGTWIIL